MERPERIALRVVIRQRPRQAFALLEVKDDRRAVAGDAQYEPVGPIRRRLLPELVSATPSSSPLPA
jgi:hypothetical protein